MNSWLISKENVQKWVVNTYNNDEDVKKEQKVSIEGR